MFDERSDWQKFCDLAYETLVQVLFYAAMYGFVLTVPVWFWLADLIWGKVTVGDYRHQRGTEGR